MQCKIVKIDLDKAVKTFLLFLVFILSSTNISLVCKRSNFFYSYYSSFFRYFNGHSWLKNSQNWLTEIFNFSHRTLVKFNYF